jgi:hypothetical protein
MPPKLIGISMVLRVLLIITITLSNNAAGRDMDVGMYTISVRITYPTAVEGWWTMYMEVLDKDDYRCVVVQSLEV